MATAPSGTQTRADLDAMPDDGHRYELLEGFIVNVPSPSSRHQEISFGLQLVLHAACPAELKVLAAPLDVDLGVADVPQPDLVVARSEQFGERGVVGTPLLVVEILSRDRRRDLVVKRRVYEQAGIASYWILDPETLTLTVLELGDRGYVDVATVSGSATWTATSPFAVTVVPDRLVR